MSDLWTEASYDAEAATKALNLETARHASSGIWSFLALAASPQEYGDRVALAADSITTVAQTHDVPVETLLSTFDHRFALLMEAGSNPFADDSQDDSGDDDKESKDDDSDDDSDSDDSDDSDKDDSDKDSDDNGDGNADDSDDDEDSDDTGDGDDEDDDSDNDGGSDDSGGSGAPPWANKFSALARRIQAGENPLEWSGNAPFVRSSARKHAADGAEPVTDTNVPQDPAAGAPDADPTGNPMGGATPGAPTVPGMDGGIAASTKPRQLPEGDGTGPGMGMDGITGEFDPDLNGGDIEQGADSTPDGAPEDDDSSKIAAIAAEVRRYNPTLSRAQAHKVAQRAYDTYLAKHAEDVNPLLYGDRAPVGDGPISGPLKNWSPADMKPPKLPGMPGGGGAPKPPGAGGAGGAGGAPELPAAGEGAAGAGELAAGAGEAAELLPLLAL